jgi:hypothetical protein
MGNKKGEENKNRVRSLRPQEKVHINEQKGNVGNPERSAYAAKQDSKRKKAQPQKESASNVSMKAVPRLQKVSTKKADFVFRNNGWGETSHPDVHRGIPNGVVLKMPFQNRHVYRDSVRGELAIGENVQIYRASIDFDAFYQVTGFSYQEFGTTKGYCYHTQPVVIEELSGSDLEPTRNFVNYLWDTCLQSLPTDKQIQPNEMQSFGLRVLSGSQSLHETHNPGLVVVLDAYKE